MKSKKERKKYCTIQFCEVKRVNIFIFKLHIGGENVTKLVANVHPCFMVICHPVTLTGFLILMGELIT